MFKMCSLSANILINYKFLLSFPAFMSLIFSTDSVFPSHVPDVISASLCDKNNNEEERKEGREGGRKGGRGRKIGREEDREEGR